MNKYSDLRRSRSRSQQRSSNVIPRNDTVYDSSSLRLSMTDRPLTQQTLKSVSDSLYTLQDFKIRTSNGSGLSLYTEYENLRQVRKLPLELTSTSRRSKSTQYIKRAPSKVEFDYLITKLGNVSNNSHFGQRRIVLKEGYSNEILLDKDACQYSKVNCKGKLCPMIVNITRSVGRVESFVSFKVSEPNEELCDDVYKKDCFQINDSGLKFRMDYVYICFQAMEESIFSVSIYFGSVPLKVQFTKLVLNRIKGKIESPKNEDIDEDNAIHLEQDSLDKAVSKHKSISNVNFVIRNKLMMNSWMQSKTSSFLIKRNLAQRRREEVADKKDKIEEEKRTKSQLKFRKQEIRKEEEKKAYELNVIKLNKEKFETMWLSFLYLAKGSAAIFSKIQNKKSELLHRYKISSTARLIQKKVRRWTGEMSVHDIAIERASALLRNYRLYSLAAFQCIVHKQIYSCVQFTAQAAVSSFKFIKFYNRIRRIQQAWRNYKIKKNTRWNGLVEKWFIAVERLQSQPSRSKKRKRGKEHNERYIIPVPIRNTVIKQYFHTRRQSFRLKYAEYQKNKPAIMLLNKNLKIREAVAFITDFKPCLRYDPTDEEIRNMVESAVKIKEDDFRS